MAPTGSLFRGTNPLVTIIMTSFMFIILDSGDKQGSWFDEMGE
jgi:hypothetical protein